MFAPLRRAHRAALYFPKSLLGEQRLGEIADDICWTVMKHRAFLDDGFAPLAPDSTVTIRKFNTHALCHELGISTATFRRRNHASGNTFRRFREETLVEASLTLLVDETRSIGWIASQLGYADVRSYRRFIKGATGRTPDQLRVENRANAMANGHPNMTAALKYISTKLSQ